MFIFYRMTKICIFCRMIRICIFYRIYIFCRMIRMYIFYRICLKIKNVVIAPNNWVWILLSMILGYLGEVFRGMRWVLLIKPLGYNVKVLDCINSVASGYMFNAGVPRSGEIARCTLLNKTTKTPISYLFGHVLHSPPHLSDIGL